jgi:cytochrome oxidase Cu insertion factor (SCO1/SenC/PrrC family)
MLVAVWGGTPILALADGRRSAGRAAGETPRYVRSLETYRVPPVVLVNQQGEKVALASVLDEDKTVLVNFLFTSCTTTCPVVTATVASMRQVLGSEGQDLRILSISIDPAHDTPKVLQAYARQHGLGSGWQLLTGDASQVRTVLKAFSALAGSTVKPYAPHALEGSRKSALGTDQWFRERRGTGRRVSAIAPRMTPISHNERRL